MKRIAALAAGALATLALVSVPATAMASTSGGGHTPGHEVRLACPAPGHGLFRLPKSVRLELLRHHKGLRIRVVRIGCIRLLCPAEVVRFYQPAGGRALTEISGPALRTGEQVIYRGESYTVASVSGAVFTMSVGGQVLVSRGVPVHDGVAFAVLACR